MYQSTKPLESRVHSKLPFAMLFQPDHWRTFLCARFKPRDTVRGEFWSCQVWGASINSMHDFDRGSGWGIARESRKSSFSLSQSQLRCECCESRKKLFSVDLFKSSEEPSLPMLLTIEPEMVNNFSTTESNLIVTCVIFYVHIWIQALPNTNSNRHKDHELLAPVFNHSRYILGAHVYYVDRFGYLKAISSDRKPVLTTHDPCSECRLSNYEEVILPLSLLWRVTT